MAEARARGGGAYADFSIEVRQKQRYQLNGECVDEQNAARGGAGIQIMNSWIDIIAVHSRALHVMAWRVMRWAAWRLSSLVLGTSPN